MNDKQKAAAEVRRFAGMLQTLARIGEDLKEVGDREAAVEALDRSIEARRETVTDLEGKLQGLHDEIAEASQQAGTIGKQITDDARGIAERIIKDANGAAEEVYLEKAGPKLKELADTVTSLEASNADAARSAADLRNRLDAMTSERDELRGELAGLRKKLQGLVG